MRDRCDLRSGEEENRVWREWMTRESRTKVRWRLARSNNDGRKRLGRGEYCREGRETMVAGAASFILSSFKLSAHSARKEEGVGGEGTVGVGR